MPIKFKSRVFIALAFVLAVAGGGFAQPLNDNRATCDNGEPVVPPPETTDPDCGDQPGTENDFPTTDGGPTPTIETKKLLNNQGNVGDPINAAKRLIYHREIDFQVSLSHGLNFEVSRFYVNSTISHINDAKETMYGPYWIGNYEDRLYSNAAEHPSTPSNWSFFLISSTTAGVKFYHEGSIWKSRLYDGHPMELRIIDNGTDPDHYRIWYPDLTEKIFDEDGRLIRITPNRLSGSDAYLSLSYDGSGRLTEVSSSVDDRYLEYLYSGSEKQVSQILLWTAAPTDYLVANYTYDATTKKLLRARPYSSNHGYVREYEYGSMSVYGGQVYWSPSSTSPNLGMVSYYLDYPNDKRPLTAYGNNYDFDCDCFVLSMLSFDPEFTPDPSCSSTPGSWTYDCSPWRVIARIHGDHRVEYTYGLTNPPTTFPVRGYGHIITEVAYQNLSVSNSVDSFHADLVQPGYGDYPNLIQSTKKKTGTNTYHTLKEYHYGILDSSTPFLAKFRVDQKDKYSSDNPSSVMTTTYTYSTVADFENFVTEIESPTGETTTYTYETSNASSPAYAQITSVTNPSGITTSYTYYGASDPDGAFGLLKETIGQYGTTTYKYDDRGNVTEIEYPSGVVITRTYNDFNQVLRETTSNMEPVDYVYSNQTHYLNPSTRTANTSDPIPTAQKFIPPRLLQVVDRTGGETRFEYATNGQRTKVTDANGKITLYTYDERSRLSTVTNPASEVTTYEYDEFDRMTVFTDGEGNETRYEYDEFGRLIKTIEEKEGVSDPDIYTEMVYGGGSGGCGGCGTGGGSQNVTRIRQQDGNYVHFAYDDAGRTTKVWYSSESDPTNLPSTPDIEYDYDKSSRVTQVTDSRLTLAWSDWYTFEYDTGNTGRLERIVHPEGYTQEYFFQDDNMLAHYRRMIGYKDVDGNVVRYAYDSLGRLETLTDAYGGDASKTYLDDVQTTQPIGGLEALEYANGARTEYLYDEGRTDRIDFRNQAGDIFDYIDLAYDPAGLITQKQRGNDADGLVYSIHYDYDDAYRMIEEEYRNPSSTAKSRRSYTYDDAGNRATMNQWNDASVNNTTTYAYGKRNQIKTNTGYFRGGTTSTGAMTYGFDIKGNMTSQSATGVGSTYEWTADNRLKKATVASGDFKLPPQEVHYKYDYAGRRLLKHVGTAGQRTRHFFNGLTEEIKKVSVGTHADTSFAFVTMVDGTSTTGWVQGWGTGASIASVYDADRFSDVLELEPVTRYDFGWGSLRTEKTVSFWFKYGSGGTAFAFPVSTSLGNRRVHLIFTNGTSGYHSGTTEYRVYMGTAMNDGEWHRVEVDFSRIVATQTPGGTFNGTWGVWVYSYRCWLDDLRLSNSMTVEHNTLGGGVIGHILRNRSINVAGIVPTATDRWFHYDQVGSVMATTNASGAHSELRHPDAFGNRMATWQSGLWTNTYAERKGWGHNSKEFDADTGLVYMYQRWYNPELGLFGSKAPYPPRMEHQYGFANNDPAKHVDPHGLFPFRDECAEEGCSAARNNAQGDQNTDYCMAYETCTYDGCRNPRLTSADLTAEIAECVRELEDVQMTGNDIVLWCVRMGLPSQ